MDKKWKCPGSPSGSSTDPNNSWEPVLFGNHGCRLPETLRLQQSVEDAHLSVKSVIVCYGKQKKVKQRGRKRNLQTSMQTYTKEVSFCHSYYWFQNKEQSCRLNVMNDYDMRASSLALHDRIWRSD